MSKSLPHNHPVEILLHYFMEPIGFPRYRLPKDSGVPPQRIGDIVAGKRAITADTDLRLCRYFSLTDGYWLRGQARYDTECARDALHEDLERIQPLAQKVAYP